MGRLIFCIIFFAACSSFAADGEVIGRTTVFHLVHDSFLVANDPGEVVGVQAFNYFFSIELFCGLFACWIKMFLATLKKEVL